MNGSTVCFLWRSRLCSMDFLYSHSAAHQRVQPWWISWSPYHQFVRNKIRSTVFRINGPLLLLLSSWLADTGTIPMFDSISQPRACFYISVSQASLGHIAIALEKGPNAQSISSSLCLRGTTDVSQTHIFDQASLQGWDDNKLLRDSKAWRSCWILPPCKRMFFTHFITRHYIMEPMFLKPGDVGIALVIFLFWEHAQNVPYFIEEKT
jgi:hypothetical protein